MTGRPVRRRVLTEVEQAGEWPVVLARIASGESITEIARSFGVSRSFMSRLLHEDRERHALVVEARWRAEGDALLLDAVEMIGGFSRPDAARLRAVLGERAAPLDRETLATLDRLRAALEGGALTATGVRPWLSQRAADGLGEPGLGQLFIESASRASRRTVPTAAMVASSEPSRGM